MRQRLDEIVVIKIGGNEAEDPAYLADLALELRAISAPKLIVHGGGKTISSMQKALGQEPKFVDGQRYTDEAGLGVAEMVLCGTANKRLVRALVAAGHNALGISGMDAKILQCTEADESLGLVGKPQTVNARALLTLIEAGFLPVVAPLGLLPDGASANINADLAAAAIATHIHAAELIFLTNVVGIRIGSTIATRLESIQVRAAMLDGEITGGMVPKVLAALSAAEQNIPVRICDLDGMLTGGTTIYAEDFAIDRGYTRSRRAIHIGDV
jgi:acetylglutamate kinase